MDWASKINEGDVIELSESDEILPSLATEWCQRHSNSTLWYCIRNHSVFSTDEVQTITLRDFKSKQEVINTNHNAYLKKKEVQVLRISEPRKNSNY